MPCPSLDFCQQLFTQGVALATNWEVQDAAEQATVERLIEQVDAIARLDAPGSAPPLDMPAAKWGLSALAWGTLVLVDRADRRTELPESLAASEPSGRAAEHHWSVDLAFRFLGGIIARVKLASSNDPLAVTLEAMASRWPLASVGTRIKWSEEALQVVVSHESLRRLMLDRIIERRDTDAAGCVQLQPYLDPYTHLLADWPR